MDFDGFISDKESPIEDGRLKLERPDRVETIDYIHNLYHPNPDHKQLLTYTRSCEPHPDVTRYCFFSPDKK